MGELASKHKIKLGYAPTRRNVFSREDAAKYKKLTEEKLRSWGVDLVNIDWLNEEGLLYSEDDVTKVARKFKEQGVDAVFSPHCNFGTESAVSKLAAEMKLPFLLWGPRDEAPLPDGSRLRDTQCGLFATGKILRRFNVPYTYIVNSRLDDPVFKTGFDNFMRAASVVKAFRSLRIGQLSTRPADFWTVMVNEGELLEKFGIEVVPTTLVEIVNAAKKIVEEGGEELKETIADFKAKVSFPGLDEDIPVKLAALKLAIRQWAESANLSAIAIQCWNALQDVFGVVPCFVNGLLTDEGIPVSCETDIHGAVTSVMVQAARMGESATFFADLTIRHPENDNAELLWHCGPFPYSLKEESYEGKVGKHFILESAAPGVGEWRIKGGDVTIARFDGDHGEYSLFIGEGKGTDGPHTRGTYIWIEVDDWPMWEDKLVTGPYIHHVVGVHGKLAPALYEACKYIPGLKPDPATPTEAEILKRLRG